jgi:hypothetical protein
LRSKGIEGLKIDDEMQIRGCRNEADTMTVGLQEFRMALWVGDELNIIRQFTMLRYSACVPLRNEMQSVTYLSPLFVVYYSAS